MADGPKSYPYATHLNVRYGPLELVDVPALVAACTDRWYNQTLCRVNDSVVRLGVIRASIIGTSTTARTSSSTWSKGVCWSTWKAAPWNCPRNRASCAQGFLHRTRARSGR